MTPTIKVGAEPLAAIVSPCYNVETVLNISNPSWCKGPILLKHLITFQASKFIDIEMGKPEKYFRLI